MRVGIVIPARNEQDLIGRCLDAIAIARASTPAEVRVIVVADACSDRTAEIAARSEDVTVHRSAAANVGIARAVGSQLALALGCTWLAHTDADSVVPPNWIAEQLDIAAAGHDGMIGTVQPDFSELPSMQVEHWLATHHRGQPNGHVHGANLGVSAAAYVSVGGFGPLLEHEDVDLVERLRAAGVDLVASDRAEVMTSGRFIGRTAGGYAGHLRRVNAMLDEGSGALAV